MPVGRCSDSMYSYYVFGAQSYFWSRRCAPRGQGKRENQRSSNKTPPSAPARRKRKLQGIRRGSTVVWPSLQPFESFGCDGLDLLLDKRHAMEL